MKFSRIFFPFSPQFKKICLKLVIYIRKNVVKNMKKDSQLNGSIYTNSKNVFVPNLYCSVGTLSLTFTSFIASLGQLAAQTPHPKQ